MACFAAYRLNIDRELVSNFLFFVAGCEMPVDWLRKLAGVRLQIDSIIALLRQCTKADWSDYLPHQKVYSWDNLHLCSRAITLGRLEGKQAELEHAGLRITRDGTRTTYEYSAERMAEPVLARVKVTPEEISSLLSATGVSTTTKEGLDDFAIECTIRTIDSEIGRLSGNARIAKRAGTEKRQKQKPERQLAIAIATLKRELPVVIDAAERRGDPRVDEYRALLDVAEKNPGFTPLARSPQHPEVFAPAKPSWHTAARALAMLYRLHINPDEGFSSGPGVRFIVTALGRIGWAVSPAAVRKALDRKRHKPDLWLEWPPNSYINGVLGSTVAGTGPFIPIWTKGDIAICPATRPPS